MANGKQKALTEFQRGFVAGYDKGLAECGPLAGVTGYFGRRRKRKKIAQRGEQEKQQLLQRAMEEHAERLQTEREAGEAALNPSGKVVLRSSYMDWPYEVYLRPDGRYDGWIEGDRLAAIGMSSRAQAVDRIKRSIRAYHREGDIPRSKHTAWERLWGRRRPEITAAQARRIQQEEGLINPMAKKKWISKAITRPGKLGGKGFLSKPRAKQKEILDRCVSEYGYRSCLGSVTILEQIPQTKQKYGRTLTSLRKYLVKSYGGPGSFGPQHNPVSVPRYLTSHAKDPRMEEAIELINRGDYDRAEAILSKIDPEKVTKDVLLRDYLLRHIRTQKGKPGYWWGRLKGKFNPVPPDLTSHSKDPRMKEAIELINRGDYDRAEAILVKIDPREIPREVILRDYLRQYIRVQKNKPGYWWGRLKGKFKSNPGEFILVPEITGEGPARIQTNPAFEAAMRGRPASPKTPKAKKNPKVKKTGRSAALRSVMRGT